VELSGSTPNAFGVVAGGPAGNSLNTVSCRIISIFISASCRDVQAGSLRSPDHGRGGGVGRTLGVVCGLGVGVGLGVIVGVAVGVGGW